MILFLSKVKYIEIYAITFSPEIKDIQIETNMMHSETCDTVGVGVCKICIMQNIFLGATRNKSMERDIIIISFINQY